MEKFPVVGGCQTNFLYLQYAYSEDMYKALCTVTDTI